MGTDISSQWLYTASRTRVIWVAGMRRLVARRSRVPDGGRAAAHPSSAIRITARADNPAARAVRSTWAVLCVSLSCSASKYPSCDAQFLPPQPECGASRAGWYGVIKRPYLSKSLRPAARADGCRVCCPTTATAGGERDAKRQQWGWGGGQVCDGAWATQSALRGQSWLSFGRTRARALIGCWRSARAQAAQWAHNRRQKHVCFCLFRASRRPAFLFDETEFLCKEQIDPPWQALRGHPMRGPCIFVFARTGIVPRSTHSAC